MDKTRIGLTLWVLLLVQTPVWADSPIYQGLLWDSAPAAAYNTQRGEFLVVWNVYNPLYPSNDVRFFGPVLGQLIKENGQKLGEPFEIIASGGVLPKVAYNAQANQYLVVAEQWYNTVGQRVSAFGMKIGGLTTLLTNARYPRMVYNSLSHDYLVTGAWPTETAPGSGLCNLQLSTLLVSATGQPQGAATTVADEYIGTCAEGARYALDYAPLVSTKAPQGRYLLAINSPIHLKMLDSQGKVLPVLYDAGHNSWYENVPFQQSKVGQPYHIDIGYGNWNGQPAFFLVWGDIDQDVSGYGQWTGIWGGIVAADKELYYTTDPVSNEVFPISYQFSHETYPDIYKQWKPVVRYNTSSNRFVVSWRETPGSTNTQDPTNVNHIRVNTSDSYRVPPLMNLIVSSTNGTENPVTPTLATSTRTTKALVAWEDHRGLLGFGDIYGTLFDAATRSTSSITPGGVFPSYSKFVSAGTHHSLGIQGDGSLWSWGNGDMGKLGLNDTQDRHVPTQVGIGTDWVAVSGGHSHSLGIKKDGSFWAWGNNSVGQLGLNDTQDRHVPTQVGTWTDWATATLGSGNSHSLGIRKDGSLWAWGYNFSGQLGLNDTQDRHVPTQVGIGTDWATAEAGWKHSLGIKKDGSLWAWGDNNYGQLGLIDTQYRYLPTQVGAGSDWAAVTAGALYSLGIKKDGSLWAWGYNFSGQLGLNDTQDRPVPTQVGIGTDWAAVAAGEHHSLGIKKDGSLWAWGYNNYGQLGLNDTQNRYLPTRVGAGSDWLAVADGVLHSLGLRSDGCLWAWGYNNYGQLGLNDQNPRYEPTLVPNSCPGNSPMPSVLNIWLPLILRN